MFQALVILNYTFKNGHHIYKNYNYKGSFSSQLNVFIFFYIKPLSTHSPETGLASNCIKHDMLSAVSRCKQKISSSKQPWCKVFENIDKYHLQKWDTTNTYREPSYFITNSIRKQFIAFNYLKHCVYTITIVTNTN